MINYLLEKKILPDWLVRAGIRRLLAQRLKSEESRKSRFENWLAALEASGTAADAGAKRRDLPALFFQLILGRHMSESSGYWFESTQSLADAEEAMLRIIGQRANIASGQRILELGTGWGSFSLWAAENFPKSRIVGLADSRTQKDFIDSQILARGLKNLTILISGLHSFDTTETFDRVVSIGMFERMRNWETLLKKIALWLEPHGYFFMQIVSHREYAYSFEDPGRGGWMAQELFPGGFMPSDRMIYHFQRDLKLVQHWFVPGTHYAQTAEAWLKNLDLHQEEILAIFGQAYGPGRARKWLARWRTFLMSCA